MRIFAMTVAALAFTASAASAQDPVKVDPKHYKVEFENEHVRVLRITYGPGEESVTHEHPAGVAVFLTDGTFQMNVQGAQTNEPQPGKRGQVTWAVAETHTPRNVGTGAAEVLLIELKGAAGRGPGDR